MNNMYYTENPDSKHELKEIDVHLLGETFRFLTDSGVFSKKMVDYGSQVLLNNFDFKKEKTLLDVGCGYGPLGISLAKVYGLEVTMVDINRRALDLAEINAEKNGVNATIFQSNTYENVSGCFDAVISNPPIRAGKEVVHAIIEGSMEHLNTGGSLTIVIQKKQGAPSAKAKMEQVFGNAAVLKRDKGYYVLRSEKEGE
ncbi:class I SAM-dependent methyltransferase [Streptococcus caviae]|uniref:class I SAM-dependent methyltransferase n=1 Tax=Streptococcus sp. 'caviae' TaxID=1915004 RepID=UPI00094B8EA4|nr:class I SAM-dependent methyltransferase [Streptococcus sp. 'caviae']OLN82632.1 methyltransferase [Streptococcus sp. 'caviae']